MREEEEFRERIDRALWQISAPRPPIERVVRRSRILRVRQSLVATIAFSAALTAVAIPLIWLAPLREDHLIGVPGSPEPGPTPSVSITGQGRQEPGPAASEQGRFTPPTHRRGDAIVMPVTFPDGSTAEVMYPPELGLAESLGISGSTVAGNLGDQGEGCGFDISILFGRDPSVISGEAPVVTYDGADGGLVELWRGGGDHPDIPFILLYRFGRWVAWVPCYESPTEHAASQELWASSLRGRLTEEGFLILVGLDPLRLSREGGFPSLQIGANNSISLTPAECEPDDNPDADVVNGHMVSRWPRNAVWCEPEEPMKVHVFSFGGDDSFIEAVVQGVHAHNVKLSSDPSEAE